MRWNRRFIVCCSSLVLLGFTACKKVVKINVDQSLAPLSAITEPGKSLEWVALAPGESFDVNFESGLCTQKSPIHATYGNPAICTVAQQTFGPQRQPIRYTYSIEGSRPEAAASRLTAPPQSGGAPPPTAPSPTPYSVLVGPGHCPHC